MAALMRSVQKWMRPAVGTDLTPAATGVGGRPALAGGAGPDPLEPTVAASEGTRRAEPEVVFVAVAFGAATLEKGETALKRPVNTSAARPGNVSLRFIEPSSLCHRAMGIF